MSVSSTADSVNAKLNPNRHTTPLMDAWNRYKRNPLAVAGAVVIILLVLTVLLGPLFTPYDPYKNDYATLMQSPSVKHLLGTDQYGRDVLTRLITAGQYSILISVSSMLICLVIGLPLGGLAGMKGGRVDFFIMRLLDIINAFPTLLLQMVLSAMLGSLLKKGAWTIILVLSLTGWVGFTWLIRSQLLSLREKEFVTAARAIGANDWYIIRKYLILNALGPIIVAISFGIPGLIGAEAGLSFLGLGISPPTPTWGQMLGESSKYVQTISTWYMVMPPAVIMATVLLAFQFMGDGMQSVFNPSTSD
jgi:oligopeptide transport system permease protein